jgi:type I restriction enzyme M protein
LLDTDTKRRIDTARDILVGKVPDPKSQVEQITIALIYKFMDDMDAESEELGGKRKFFTGNFARFGWAKLMRAGLGGHETLNLYAEGITTMPQNPGIPPLFRDIFKNAYLPYRDPETLKSFLKVIDEFSYDHSERLGDAFEYLLSVLGSQGDAGQFRTPRHIIDFIVSIVDPKKDETILDPACGTAGFLISAYKHILRANRDAKHKVKLTPDEKGRLVQNIKGYDISPDMVRLSLVNLYLHGFPLPHIYEYDTLTQEERWKETADVILANPPFMSPKGGIKPHKRFSIQAKRSEVLFVDYMAEHLTPGGRAGIIVPEGIIFQSQTAYKDLRKELVENSLVAVISLPAGCFNPYSGVKTSILILDKSIARQSDTIGFFKVENDGFGLGAQRRAMDGSDLPQVKAEIDSYFHALRSHKPTDELNPTCGLFVPKKKIAENGDYNLSGERYRESTAANHLFPLVPLGDATLFRVESGGTPKSEVEDYWNGGIPWATLVDLPATDFISEISTTKRTISKKGLKESSAKLIPANSVVVSTRATIGRIAINRVPIATNQGFKNVVIEDYERAVPEYIAIALTRLVPTMQAWATGGTFAEISKSKFCELQIPLPPLEVQNEIVAEIEGYQKVIDGARAVLDNYRPFIPINPDWPLEPLGIHFSTTSGGTPPTGEPTYWAGTIPWVSPKDMKSDVIYDTEDHLSEAAIANSATKLIPAKSVICVVRSGILKHTFPVALLSKDMCINQDIIAFSPLSSSIDSRFLFYVLKTRSSSILAKGIKPGVTVQSFYNGFFKDYQFPVPPLATQRAIVAKIEAEQELVAATRELIPCVEKKIQATLARVWGEDEPAATEA